MTAEQMTVVNEKLSHIERLFEAPAQAGEQVPQPIFIQTPATSSADSHLFTVRLWPEAVDDDLVEWRGKVDHVATGEVGARHSRRNAGHRLTLGSANAPLHANRLLGMPRPYSLDFCSTTGIMIDVLIIEQRRSP